MVLWMWECGVGLICVCGIGVCVMVVVVIWLKRVLLLVEVVMVGGMFSIVWGFGELICMIGLVIYVFSGEIDWDIFLL